MSEKIVQFNEEIIKGQLKELVRGSVEETLNELLEKEAESLTQAARYERSEARHGYRSGHYDRNLTTTSGNVTLHMPRLKGMSFETAIIERYRRRESSVEEALIEMYLAGVSVRRVVHLVDIPVGLQIARITYTYIRTDTFHLLCVPQRECVIITIRKYDSVRLARFQIVRTEITANITVRAIMVVPVLRTHLDRNQQAEYRSDRTRYHRR